MSLRYSKHSLSVIQLLPYIRAHSTSRCGQPIVHIPPGSHVYAFGSASQSSMPLFQDFDWTVQDGEAWAVISGTGREKTNILKVTITILFSVAHLIVKIDASWPHQNFHTR